MVRPHEVYDAHSQHSLALDHKEGVIYDALVTQEACVIDKCLDGGIIDLRLQDIRPSVFVHREVGVKSCEGLLANRSRKSIDLRPLQIIHLQWPRHPHEDILHHHKLINLASDCSLVNAIDLREVAETTTVSLILHVFQIRRCKFLELHELLFIDDFND